MNPSSYRALWEQPFFDLWSIPHFLSGALVFFIAERLKVNVWLGYAANLIIAILWEVFEGTTGISASEYFSNHLSDVLMAQLGYGVAVLVLMRFGRAEEGRLRIERWALAVFAAFIVLGVASAKLFR